MTPVLETDVHSAENIFEGASSSHSDVDSFFITRKLPNAVIQHAMGNKIVIPEISLNTWGLFFCKVVYTSYDVLRDVLYRQYQVV
jgi:hypothetical protein